MRRWTTEKTNGAGQLVERGRGAYAIYGGEKEFRGHVVGIDILHIEKGYLTETRRDETLSLVDTPNGGLEHTRMGSCWLNFSYSRFLSFGALLRVLCQEWGLRKDVHVCICQVSAFPKHKSIFV